jgi:hypothetical protein
MPVDSISSSQFDQFVKFANSAMTSTGEKSVAKLEGTTTAQGDHKIDVRTDDKVGALFRKGTTKTENDAVRDIFRDSVYEMFGGESKVPASVKDAMLMGDYRKGKPLTARRILAVKQAIDSVVTDFNTVLPQAKAIASTKRAYNGLDAAGRAQADVLVGVAIKSCIADKDALAVVMKNIDRIIAFGDGSLRSADGIKQKVEEIVANFNEIRTLAKKNSAVMSAGRDFMNSLEGKSLPPGMIGGIVNSVSGLKVDAMKHLSPSSSCSAIHKAIVQFDANIEEAMTSSGAARALEGGDELEPARNFVADLMLSKCGSSAVAKMQQAFNTDKMKKLVTFYGDVHVGVTNQPPNASYNQICALHDQASIYRKMLQAFKYAVDLKCGVPNNQKSEVPDYPGRFDYSEVDGNQIQDEIFTAGKKLLQTERQKFLEHVVQGDSDGARFLRSIYDGIIGPEQYNPKGLLEDQTSAITTAKLNWSMATSCKRFATGDALNTPFAKDIVRGMEVHLSNGVTLPHNFDQAREELAKFVADDPNATYAGLDVKSQRKVHIAMALLSQESIKAGFEGHSTALDPQKSSPAFGVGGPQDTARRVFNLSFENNGELVLRFEGTQPTDAIVKEDGSFVRTGPGSRLESSFSFKIKPDELDRLADVDFSTFDDTAANAVLDDPNVTSKPINAVSKFDPQFQFTSAKITCYSHFGATIN